MGDCPNCFGAQLSLPPSPKFSGGSYTPPVPTVLVDFNMAMDIGVVPAAASFEVVVDGTPQTPTSPSWADSDTLNLTITGVASVSIVVNLLVVDTNLRSADEVIAVAPQSIQVFP